MPTQLSTELEWQKWQEEDERLCHTQAIFLLEELDPNIWAVSANKTGIYLQPREQVRWLTSWERELKQWNLRLPAAWTGYLSAMHPRRQETWRKYSLTSSMCHDISPKDRSSERAVVVAFSLNRLLTLMQEFSSVGRPMTGESMQEKYQ